METKPPATTHSSPALGKMLMLFDHPRFSTSISLDSEIITPPPKTMMELNAKKAISFWYESGLQKPRSHNLKKAEDDAVSNLIAVMKGKHPFVITNPPNKKFTLAEIYESIKNYKIALTDPHYQPLTKTSLQKLSLSKFIYNKWTRKSLLVKYLTPPPSIVKEKNPQLTKCLMNAYAHAKWGSTAKDVEQEHRFSFIKASNRLMKYLEEHQKEFNYMLGLSLKNPKPAADGLIACAKNSGNFNSFDPEWLSNQHSIQKLDSWLRSQSFLRPSSNR
jgi:hypothetical protein